MAAFSTWGSDELERHHQEMAEHVARFPPCDKLPANLQGARYLTARIEAIELVLSSRHVPAPIRRPRRHWCAVSRSNGVGLTEKIRRASYAVALVGRERALEEHPAWLVNAIADGLELAAAARQHGHSRHEPS